MKIPVENIYYLLCYAWDKLEEGNRVEVSSSDYKTAANLFARVLINGFRYLLKSRLDRNYVEHTEPYVGIKGKIDFKQSLNKNLFRHGRSVCTFDEFDADILQNQLIKASFLLLTKAEELEPRLKAESWDCYRRLNSVSDIKPQLSLFSKVIIHRNNSFYDFLLKICKPIIENIVLDQRTGRRHFREFVGSEKAMAALFEGFVRNFYKKEQKVFKVFREDIYWDVSALGNSDISYLPKMQTDISLESVDRKIIIETKYYQETLAKRFDSEKIHSGNLYQLYSYLRNIETKQTNKHNAVCEGILLYPTIDNPLDETFLFGNHKLRIKTVNLDQNWSLIASDLLSLLN